MPRSPHARPTTRLERRLIVLGMMPGNRGTRPRSPWCHDPRTLALVAIPLGLVLGGLACLVLGDLVMIPHW